MGRREHWEEVYRTKPADTVSWYQEIPEPSLRALERMDVPLSASVIDVGGGASLLVDHLLDRGFADVTVLDLAASALEAARKRLGPAAARVHWEVQDATLWSPHRTYDIWHDRAVFHFLTEAAQRRAYLDVLDKALAPDGLVIIATFAPEGPEKCSGLPVRRYDAAALSEELGTGFALLDSWHETHETPGGSSQAFTWCVFRKA